jgi:hypothetical protein
MWRIGAGTRAHRAQLRPGRSTVTVALVAFLEEDGPLAVGRLDDGAVVRLEVGIVPAVLDQQGGVGVPADRRLQVGEERLLDGLPPLAG